MVIVKPPKRELCPLHMAILIRISTEPSTRCLKHLDFPSFFVHGSGTVVDAVMPPQSFSILQP